MDNKYSVRIIRSVIENIKNVNYGEIPYMNYNSVVSRGNIEKTDIVGVYGQNGSGKTALVESLGMLKYILWGQPIPYEEYGGILSSNKNVSITTDFFIEKEGDDIKHKAAYTVFLRPNSVQKQIEIYKEKLVYWTRSASWSSERDILFENSYYNNVDILEQKRIKVISDHERKLKSIPFLFSMQNLAVYCAQNKISVFFNNVVLRELVKIGNDYEAICFKNVITGIMQFGTVDLNVIKVNQLGTINHSQIIPIHIHKESEHSITQECINLYIGGSTEIPKDSYLQTQSVIDGINIAMRSIVPGLQIELETKQELERPDGTQSYQVDVYANRDGNRFLIKYESEGIKRIISILNYLISVYNNSGVCLVVDELDSGIFEYLLGEILGLLGKEMKGQLIFTSHNLRVLEKLDYKNIICSTTNPDNRYIRLRGVEKNNNRRDFYIRAITVGGQKEELYDEKDLIAMGYAFRKAGKVANNSISIKFSPEFEQLIKRAEN